jgi:hypothetical protein
MISTELLAAVQANHRDDLAFERRDARYGWWAALLVGAAAGVLLGAWLASR